MEKRVEGSHIEDLANRGGPELCVGVPRGRSEALARGARRPAIEPRKPGLGCQRRHGVRKATPPAASFARRRWTPRGMRVISPRSRTGRAVSPVLVDDAPPLGRGVACRRAAGRAGKAKGRNPVMHEGGRSDTPVTPEKRPNNVQGGPAEAVEGRRSAKENVDSAARPGRGARLRVYQPRRDREPSAAAVCGSSASSSPTKPPIVQEGGTTIERPDVICGAGGGGPRGRRRRAAHVRAAAGGRRSFRAGSP